MVTQIDESFNFTPSSIRWPAPPRASAWVMVKSFLIRLSEVLCGYV